MSDIYKKVFIIGGGAVALAVIAYLLLAAFGNSSKPASAPQVPNDVHSNVAGPTIQIPTPNGGSVIANNFTLNPIRTTETAILLADTDQYQITYFPQDKSFLITVLSGPASQVRSLAEKAFLEGLQIGQADACKLLVKVKVAYEADSTLAGPDYALSFCPHS